MARDKKPSLSKSRFLAGLQCPKRLYLETHERELATPPDAFQKRVFNAGHAVGELAREHFADGVLIEAHFSQVQLALDGTQKAIQAKAPAIFEAAFLAHSTFIRADILERSGDSWQIIEVKSTCSVHEEHIVDLAVQRHVIEESGLLVAKTSLMHLRRECRFPHLEDLFVQTDITGHVHDRISWVSSTIDSFLEVATSDTVPKTPVGPHCFRPYTCPFKAHCWHGVKEPTIFAIPRLHPSRARELISKDMRSLFDIPDDYPLSETQSQYVRSLKSGRPQILWPAIHDLLSSLDQPLYFLDLQSCMDVIPRHKGLRPMDQYPFQYNLHMLLENEPVELAGYLHSDSTDPRPLMAQSLSNEIDPKGTVVVWNGTMERHAIKNLAWDVSSFRGELLSIFDRIFDLQQIFQDYYFDPRFNGSTALHVVFPMLLPDFMPSTSEIQNRAEAQLAWERLIVADGEEERTRLIQALRAFGSLNATALLRIYEFLKERSLDPTVLLSLSGNDGNGRRL